MNEHERDIGAGGRTPEEIEREIQQTRSRMSRDIDELGERLSPQNLKQQAKDVISDKAHQVANNVGNRVRSSGNRLIDFVQENPSLVAAMGFGAVWLVQQRNRSEISGDRMARFAYTGPERRRGQWGQRITDRAEQVKGAVGSATSSIAEQAEEWRERAGVVAERTQERAHEIRRRASDQARRARGELGRLVEEQPLAVALGAAVLGLAFGLLVPESARERRWMGPTRDELAGRAQQVAQRVKDVAREAGEEVREAAREELSDRAPEVKSALKEAAQAVGSQVKESAARVKEEVKQAAKDATGGRGAAPA